MFSNVLFLVLTMLPQGDVVGGPLTDAIEKRIDKVSERIEAWQSGTTLGLKRLEEAQASRFAQLLEEIREVRSQRDGIFAEIAEFRAERLGLVARLQAIRDEVQAHRDELAGSWTPLQNLVDRLTGLVWRIFWLCASLVAVVVILGMVGLILYAKLRSKIMDLVEGRNG